MTHRQTPTRRRPGFSLVELLVVIAIIMLLIGLGVVVMAAAYQRTQAQQTKMILQQCLNVLSEYRTQTSSPPTGTDGNITTFVTAVKGVPACYQLMQNMGVAVFPDAGLLSTAASPPATNYIYDAWGKVRLRYYYDPTNGISNSNALTLPTSPYKQPFFVSAGIDGKFGDNLSGETGATASNATDNLYSFDK